MSFKTRFFSMLLLLVMLVSFAFSGCSIVDVSNFGMEELMQPPMPDEEKYQIKLLLDTIKKGTVTFSSPKSGVFMTACTEYDIDGDQTDEAVVFYEEKLNGVTQLYIHLFRKGANGWESAQRISASGDDIFSFNFYDLDNDGTDEILVLWENSEYEQSTKTLAVYEYKNGSIVFGNAKACEDLTVVDLQPDGRLDVVTVILEQTETASVAKAKVYKYDQQEFYLMGEVSFDSEIIGYASVSASSKKVTIEPNGVRTEYFSRVMVDGFYQNYQQLMTYVVYWDDKSNKPSIFTLEPELSTRKSTITSCDINDDGVIDLPMLVDFANTVSDDTTELVIDEALATKERMVAWHTYDTKWFTSEYTVINSKFNYILTIPEEWINDVAFIDNSSQNEYILYKWDYEKNQELGFYVKVRVFKAAYWEENKNALMNYTKVKTNKAGTLVYAICKGYYGVSNEVKLTINE